MSFFGDNIFLNWGRCQNKDFYKKSHKKALISLQLFSFALFLYV